MTQDPKSHIPIPSPLAAPPDHEDYCRQLESYLCRKNDGHLIRIVGPGFEQVCGWADRGIPLTLAMRGIDRYFERYYSKGPKRRPVRIEFCEADVLDVFDEWRRAVGVPVSAAGGAAGEAGEESDADLPGRRSSLPAHLERVIARLTTLRGGSDRSLDPVLDDIVRELDAARANARSIRGDARDALVDRLRQLDTAAVDALRQRTDPTLLQQLATEADEELKPFKPRMPGAAYEESRRACVDRLLRERAGLPTIAYEWHQQLLYADMAESLTLDIEKPTAGGRMLARHNGQIVLVWGAIPGERVRARIERSGKGVVFADTIEVVTPSPDRRDAIADWRCGGNVLAHVAYDRQRQLKAEIIRDAFARIGRMPLPATPTVIASPEHGYRMRARLHVRGGRIGFVREGSHDVCAVGPTGQMSQAAAAWIDAAEARLRDERLQGLTSIEIAENIPATERACHFELEPRTDPRRFAVLATEDMTGVSARVGDRHGVETLSGVPAVSDLIGPLRLRRDARAFFQGNRFLVEQLVERVSALVADGPVVDLYAGVGLFGLSLAASRGADVTLVEGDPVSGHDLEANAHPYGNRVRVNRSSVEDFLRRRTFATDATLIVDPPRTGMSPEAVRAIVGARPKRIIYVSCDVATLARDARALVDADYAMNDISAVDLFPNTAHVESICAFEHTDRALTIS